MIDEIIMVFVSAIITAVGFFTVKWMTSIDTLIEGVKQKVEELNGQLAGLEHDHIPLREYLENINSFKNNHVVVQNRLSDIEKHIAQLTSDAQLINAKLETAVAEMRNTFKMQQRMQK